MPRQKLPPLNLQTGLEIKPLTEKGDRKALTKAAALLRKHLGGIEVEVPDHWEEPSEGFRILVEGSHRPDWSRKEAGKMARWMLDSRDRKKRINTFAEAKGTAALWEIPAFEALTVCPRCYQLEPSPSRQVTRKTWEKISEESPQPEVRSGRFWLVASERECSTCPAVCPDKSSHRGNQIRCSSCTMMMVPIWTTKQKIPKEWT